MILKKNYTAENVIFGLILIAGAYWYFSSSTEQSKNKAIAGISTAEKERVTDAECRTDFNCWTNKFQRAAAKACVPKIERLAKNNFEWTDSLTSPKFPRAIIPNDRATTITYLGDSMKMQNGFGAWITVTYECDFDINRGDAIAVRANQGQL